MQGERNKKELNVVWLKRDLRTQDHQPLFCAEQAEEDYIIIFLFEPSLMALPDTSIRHLSFCYHSIYDMNETLAQYSRKVDIYHSEAKQVFELLCSEFNIKNVWSYQESGCRITWNRDKSVSKLFKQQQVKWEEFQRDGIIRGIKNRDQWDKHWNKTMSQPVVNNVYSVSSFTINNFGFGIPKKLKQEVEQYPECFQKPGEKMAWKYLMSFCEKRGENYFRYLSKPAQSRKSCSRISPYLAWGCISVKQAFQYVKKHPSFQKHSRPFRQFLTRLNWHCHFIQKFEADCDYESQCVNPGFELLDYGNRKAFIQAWEKGHTGIPLVDACMRCVIKTGWLNFRMRSMLVSFFCHHLDCDWRLGSYHLARQFLDYEPGIHYTQFQMQAGVTGVNTVRMYNPIKQSKDHDPEGAFIKKWVPELRNYPESFIHEPWRLTEMEKQLYNLEEMYVSPIIDVTEGAQKARAKIWSHRKHPEVTKNRERILALHAKKRRKKRATKR